MGFSIGDALGGIGAIVGGAPGAAVGGLLGGLFGGGGDDSQQAAIDSANANNAAALAAQQKAAKDNLDYQKILTYFQALQGNQQAPQQMAAGLMGQQNALDQFTQLYNQNQTNQLPLQMAQLAGLQAMTPLMQLMGMQGYQMPTTIDTTKLTAPNLLNQFTTLSGQLQGAGYGQTDATKLIQALNDPSAFLSSMGNPAAGATAAATPVAASSSSAGPNVAVPSTIREGNTWNQNGQWYSATPDGSGGLTGVPFTPGGGTPVTGFGKTGLAPNTAYPLGNKAIQVKADGTSGQLTPAQAGVATGATSPANQNLPTSMAALGTPTAAATPTTASLTPATTMASVTTNPAYQFRLQEAMKALNNKMAGSGLLNSGAAAKMAADQAMSLSGDEYNQQIQRYMDLVKLGMGMNPSTNYSAAGSQLSNIYNNASQDISGALNNAAQNRSGMYSNLANAFGTNATNSANAYSNYLGANSGNTWAAAQNKTNQPSWMSQLGSLYGSGVFGGGTSPWSSSFGGGGSSSGAYGYGSSALNDALGSW